MVAPLITDVAVSQHHLSSSQEAAAAVSNASLQCRVQVQCSAMQSKTRVQVQSLVVRVQQQSSQAVCSENAVQDICDPACRQMWTICCGQILTTNAAEL